MFWIGIAIFALLAVLPEVAVTVLNSRDKASLSDVEQPQNFGHEERIR